MSGSPHSWRPTADLAALRERAQLLRRLREFFTARDVLEVETPLLCRGAVTDPAIESFAVERGALLSSPRYLQTSPEYAMKRLLAAHGVAIYQVARAFRDAERGSRHNPEYTLLEWYRPGVDHHELMDEVAALLCHCLGERPVQRTSYRELFRRQLDIDPFTASLEALQACARDYLDPGGMSGDRDTWLDLLMSHVVEPQLALEGACFVYDYPASQAALARIVDGDGISVGQRFELYVDGMELANGYCELTDAAEQRARFERDNALRRERGQPEQALDENLLAALDAGLPPCSGVALGIDRLLMLGQSADNIDSVMAFPWDRA